MILVAKPLSNTERSARSFAVSVLKRNYIDVETAVNKISINGIEKPIVRVEMATMLFHKLDEFKFAAVIYLGNAFK